MLTVLAYLVLGIFVIGFVWRISTYLRSTAPLKIATTPAPTSRFGVIRRLFLEVVLFNSLFKGDKLAWAGSIAFHGALVLVAIRHLRYFVDPLPPLFAHIQILGVLAGLAMMGGLGVLLLRRIFIDRVRYISSKADYGWLLLLLGIGFTGLVMKFFIRPDIVAVKASMVDLLVPFQSFSPQMAGDWIFILHLLMAFALILLFPFSKLMHLGGIFFAPTRYQVDNPREKRHVNPWADK
ncbi:MAG: respiratory nitrate reductase subunit gamma [Magnetococcales bacterium]|nr:respiratory nitrate reductase subunit gamma [Magnetococcales bacterium]